MNPRYLSYCAAHGNTPDQQHAADDAAWPGGIMCGFILWIGEQWSVFEQLHGIRPGTRASQYFRGMNGDAFDAWLKETFDDRLTG